MYYLNNGSFVRFDQTVPSRFDSMANCFTLLVLIKVPTGSTTGCALVLPVPFCIVLSLVTCTKISISVSTTR